MFIELRRAWVPEDMHEDECGVCGHTIAPTSIIAEVATDGRTEMGVACPSCVEYLGSRNPETSPTIEFYLKALRKYPDPMYTGEEEMERAAQVAEPFEDPSLFAYEESWLWRVSPEIVPV